MAHTAETKAKISAARRSQPRIDPIKRFWAKVARREPNACWPWQGGKSNGYGMFNWDGFMQQSHRVAWMITNGAIPVGLSVLHSCDNPPCCNPAHLFLGTQRDNVQDMWAKNRGSRHGRRKVKQTR